MRSKAEESESKREARRFVKFDAKRNGAERVWYKYSKKGWFGLIIGERLCSCASRSRSGESKGKSERKRETKETTRSVNRLERHDLVVEELLELLP